MGSDGHIASLFPGTPALHAEDHFVAANFVEKLNAWRVTLTAPVINNSVDIVILLSGEYKAAALNEGAHQAERYPYQLIQPTHDRLL